MSYIKRGNIDIYNREIKMEQILHYPTLKTVLMVERALREAGQITTKSEFNDALENKVMWQTLEVILNYLEESGKIITGKKGILWIYNENPLMKKLKKEVFDF